MRAVGLGLAAVAFTYCWRSTAAQEQLLLSQEHKEGPQAIINAAVIGAGAAGASAAYHLSKFAADQSLPINITVFEREHYIGGRSTTVNAFDDPNYPVEVGASIFVQVNSILVDAVREFNLSTSSLRAEADEVPGASLGIWDGERFVFTQSGGAGGWWDIAKLLWKYGTAPVRTVRLMKTTVAKFLAMYEAPVFPFESLTQAAQEVELLAVTAATGEQFMRENGITGTFGRDIVQASTRVNYAQNLAYIHGLEAMVCMATDGAMAVEGGNWRIFDHMIRVSKATTRLGTAVEALEQHDNGSYTLTYHRTAPQPSQPDQATLETQLFDAVILAAPFQFANLTLSSPAAEPLRTPDKIPYVDLHVTLFTSPHLLSAAFFNLPADQAVPKVILTTLPQDETPRRGPEGVAGKPGFFSISLLQPLANPATGRREYLYKIFSPQPVDAAFLAALLGPAAAQGPGAAVTWLFRRLWHSYPYEFPRVTFEDARQGGGAGAGRGAWFYTGGMDSFISTMETNALMGRNVAALLVREWADSGPRGQSGKLEVPSGVYRDL